MSGGSMDYLGYKVKDATFREDTPERRALRKHLNKLSKALIAIEWNDSGDGADNESELIREALGDAAILEAAVQHAREAHKELGAELARVEGSWLSKEMRGKTEIVVGSYPPPKGFEAIRTVEPGVSVVIREPGHVCDGMFGIVASKFGAEDLWNVDIGKTTHAVLPYSSLEVR